MHRYLIPLLLCLPITTQAAVSINEVAWMGTTESANDEWIELINAGSAVSLEGWTLSDGMNLTIPLSGTLPASSFAVLERTDDSSAPGSAFLIYTGSLPNTGATLSLLRPDGSIEDQVAGGENWEQLGGDNVTKETAQLTARGWITAVATPGRANATIDTSSVALAESTVSTNGVSATAGSKNVRVSLERPHNELYIDIDAPTQGYVNERLTFNAVASGLGERILDSLVYEWNLGDLSVANGKEVVVSYAHPGTYVVVTKAAYAGYEAVARHTITILPTNLSLSETLGGDIFVHNDSSMEVNLSGYKLIGAEAVTFPEYSYLAPKASLRVSKEALGITGETMLGLYDRAQVLVASEVPPRLKSIDPVTLAESAAPTPARSANVTTKTTMVAPAGLISATSTTKTFAARSVEADASTDLAIANTANTLGGIPADKLPYLGLMGVIAIGILALYSRAPKAPKPKQPFGLK